MHSVRNWFFLLILVWLVQTVYGQSDEKKMSKEIRKEMKRLEKGGWKPAIGQPSLSNQLTALAELRSAVRSDGSPQYVIVEGRAISANDYNSVHFLAETQARGNLGNFVKAQVNSNSKSIINDEGATFESTSIVNSSLRLLRDKEIIALDLYRQIPNGRCESLIQIALNRDSINKIIDEE